MRIATAAFDWLLSVSVGNAFSRCTPFIYGPTQCALPFLDRFEECCGYCDEKPQAFGVFKTCILASPTDLSFKQ